MTKAEAKLIEDLRSQGNTWELVGIVFGLADEACRSAYRRAKCREIADSLKAEGCRLCGERHPDCLDFHHEDPTVKISSISDLMSRDAVIAEAAKCFILCSNCHRKLHRTLYGLYSKIEKLTLELQLKGIINEGITETGIDCISIHDAYSPESDGTGGPAFAYSSSTEGSSL